MRGGGYEVLVVLVFIWELFEISTFDVMGVSRNFGTTFCFAVC